MDVAGWIAVIVAFVGVAGGIWMQVIQFKKDAKQIGDVNNNVGRVNQHVGKVDSTLSEAKPEIKLTNENVKMLVNDMLRTVLPGIGKLDGLDTLVEAHKLDEKIKQQKSETLMDPSFLRGSIDLLYTENARLKGQAIELYHQVQELEADNRLLRENLVAAKDELKKYQPTKKKTRDDLER